MRADEKVATAGGQGGLYIFFACHGYFVVKVFRAEKPGAQCFENADAGIAKHIFHHGFAFGFGFFWKAETDIDAGIADPLGPKMIKKPAYGSAQAQLYGPGQMGEQP